MPTEQFLPFPKNFVWGAATAAYQIEGAVAEDGRGPSIWDTFSHLPGKTYQAHHGDRAADHYHRWEEDLRLMAQLGLQAYRFSIAWPRIFPEGRGTMNQAGLDFYDRLVDGLLESGIDPYVTLYHWDLPQALQDLGGWPNRQVAGFFADYAQAVAERLGDRVSHWITLNEPIVSAMNGYLFGDHAPGVQDPFQAAQAVINLMLGHGLAVQRLRAAVPGAQVGITLSLSSIHPATDTDEDRQAARRYDVISNRLFLDPILRGCLPEELASMLPFVPEVAPEDLKIISAPLDFLGVNYYSRSVVRYDQNFPFIQAAPVQPQGSEYSQMWEIYPQGIYELLVRIWQEYRVKNIYITENGVPVPDGLDFDGRVRDTRRVAYLRDHLIQVQRAIQAGTPVNGYFVWSLMDNFEWALGYQMRFGLVYVDYDNLRRTVKDSGCWYAQVIRQNGVHL